jgi:hypothetical protein
MSEKEHIMKKTLAVTVDKTYDNFYGGSQEHINAWAVDRQGEEKFSDWQRVIRTCICDLDSDAPNPEKLYLLVRIERLRDRHTGIDSYAIRYIAAAMAEKANLLRKCEEHPSFEHYAFEIDLIKNEIIYLRI